MNNLLLLSSTPSLSDANRAVTTTGRDKERRAPSDSVQFEALALDRSLSIEDPYLRSRLDAVYRSAGEVGATLPGTLDEANEVLLSWLIPWCDRHGVVFHAFVKGLDATNDVRATRGQAPRPSTAAFLDALADACESRWTVRTSVFHDAPGAGAQASRMLPSLRDVPAPCLAITAIGNDINGLLDIFCDEFRREQVRIDWEFVTERPGGQVLLSFVVSSIDRKIELSPRWWKRHLDRVFTTTSGGRVFSHLIVEELEGVESADDLYARARGSIVSVRASSESVVGTQHKMTAELRIAGARVTKSQVGPFRAKGGRLSNSIAISYDDGAMSRAQRKDLKQRLEKSDGAFDHVPTIKDNANGPRQHNRSRDRGKGLQRE